MLPGGKQTGLPLVLEPVALSSNVQHVAVVQKPVQDRRGDDGVPQKFAPLIEAFVGCEDDAAPLVPGRHQREEGGGRLPVVGPDAELINDEHLGGQVDAHPAVQVVLGPGLPQVHHQVVSANEVDSLTLPEGLESQGNGQVGLPHAEWSQDEYVGGLGDEGQVGQLFQQALVNGELEAKVKLLQGALEGQVGHSGLGGEVALPAGIHFHAHRSGVCWPA